MMALDGMIVNNSGGGQPSWGGYGRFTMGGIPWHFRQRPGLAVTTLSRFRRRRIGLVGSGVNYTIGNINSPVDLDSAGLSPVTANMFPLLDLATFGANFDPDAVRGRVGLQAAAREYRHAAQHDARYGPTVYRRRMIATGEQWQWGFFDLVNTFNNTQTNGDLDADGFAVSHKQHGRHEPGGSQFQRPVVHVCGSCRAKYRSARSNARFQ